MIILIDEDLMFKTWKRTSLVVIGFIQCHDKCIEGIFSVYTQQKHIVQLLTSIFGT